jgi:c-di-GMP-binding flagellar brake protein YcgR
MNARLLASIKSNDLSEADRRISERKLCRVSGLLHTEGYAPMRIRTVDLSIKGIAILLPVALPHGTICDLHFHLHVNNLLKAFSAKVQISNSVFLCADVRAGCRFLHVDDNSKRTLQDFMV